MATVDVKGLTAQLHYIITLHYIEIFNVA